MSTRRKGDVSFHRAAMHNALRTFGNRGFANQQLEAEFRTAYSSHGTRFLFISSALVALYYLVFVIFDLSAGRANLSDTAQLSRLSMIAGLGCLLLMGAAMQQIGIVHTSVTIHGPPPAASHSCNVAPTSAANCCRQATSPKAT